MKTIQQSICDFAASHIGEKEKAGNAGFLDAAFERLMKSVGFDPGEAWCCLFAELCWHQAYNQISPQDVAQVTALFSESCMTTWNRAKLSKHFSIGMEPRAGAVAIWQHGTGWTGHAGIVASYEPKVDKDHFNTIEGNTNAAGGREGIEVAKKRRPLSFAKKPNQLNLLGFIYPC